MCGTEIRPATSSSSSSTKRTREVSEARGPRRAEPTGAAGPSGRKFTRQFGIFVLAAVLPSDWLTRFTPFRPASQPATPSARPPGGLSERGHGEMAMTGPPDSLSDSFLFFPRQPAPPCVCLSPSVLCRQFNNGSGGSPATIQSHVRARRRVHQYREF